MGIINFVCNLAIYFLMYGTAQMQLHTREVNTRMCAGLFTRGIKPNSSSRVNSLENLLNLVSICFFSSNSATLEGTVEQLLLNT